MIEVIKFNAEDVITASGFKPHFPPKQEPVLPEDPKPTCTCNGDYVILDNFIPGVEIKMHKDGCPVGGPVTE